MLSAFANHELSWATTAGGPLTSWNPDGTIARMRTSWWKQASSLAESRSDMATTNSSPVASSTPIDWAEYLLDLSFPEGIETPLPYYAKLVVLAPEAISSTTFAAPTIVAPRVSCPSVIPRGFVQAPHSHTFPPFPHEVGIDLGEGIEPA